MIDDGKLPDATAIKEWIQLVENFFRSHTETGEGHELGHERSQSVLSTSTHKHRSESVYDPIDLSKK